jgi:hypothetical protein
MGKPAEQGGMSLLAIKSEEALKASFPPGLETMTDVDLTLLAILTCDSICLKNVAFIGPLADTVNRLKTTVKGPAALKLEGIAEVINYAADSMIPERRALIDGLPESQRGSASTEL